MRIPAFPAAAYAAHRKALMRRLPDGLILLAGGVNIVRNNDVNYVFRQHSHFLWLTGVEEAGCSLLLDPASGAETLFVPRIDAHFRVWEGHVPGPEESRRLFGVKKVCYADELGAELDKALRGHQRVYADAAAIKASQERLAALESKPEELEDALSELRAVKDDAEIELLKYASAVSAAAHLAVMGGARPGAREYQVQIELEAEAFRCGAEAMAYETIVGGGTNSAVLHFMPSARPFATGELVLIDAGAQYLGYASDITRTYPVGRRFSGRQRDIYEIVLEAQEQCIAAARPGANSADIHVLSMRVIAQGLKALKILKGETDALVMSGAVRLFYPHGFGHMLGLDVHDCLGGKMRALPNPTGVPVRFVAKLEPGFVITAEPGIYFIEALLNDPEQRAKHKDAVDFARAESFLSLGGVRIEDDLVIRKDGRPLNLTKLPKKIEDVEAACGY